MPSKARILLLGPAESVHTRRWAWALRDAGYDLVVASMHASEIAGVEVRRIEGDSSRSTEFLRTAPALRRLVREFAPDLVHAHYVSTYGMWAALSGCRRVVMSAWGSDLMEFPLRSWWHRQWIRFVLRRADAVTTSGETLAEIVQSHVPGSTSTVESIPFGVDLDDFQAIERDHGAWPVRFGTARHLEPVYGIDLLLLAFARARELGCDAQLEIVGDGELLDELRQLAGSLELGERVTFRGGLPHNDVAAFLQGLDVYCMPSRREGFGVAAVEAAATGLPTIAFAVGGLPEIVVDSETGILVNAESIEDFAAAMVRLANDARLRERMGAAARRHIERHFDWRESVARMTRVYDRLLDGDQAVRS